MEEVRKGMCEGAGGLWSTMNITSTLTGCQGTVTMEKKKKTTPNVLSGEGLLPALVTNCLSTWSDPLYLIEKNTQAVSLYDKLNINSLSQISD